MDDPRPHSDREQEPTARPQSGSRGGTPRWVRVLGIVLVIALIALFVILHLTGALGAGVHQ